MMEEKRYSVKGMSCAHCVAHVEKALKGVAGVESVEASLEDNSALVKYDSSKVKPEALKAAVDASGYELVIE